MNPPDFTHAVWRKSSRSGSNGGQCVEVAVVGGVVGAGFEGWRRGAGAGVHGEGVGGFIAGTKSGGFGRG